jgi:hypothetical protein
MKRAMSWALLVAGTALAISIAPAIPAAAATSGSEALSGTIVFAATGTTSRTVTGSVVRAKGCSGASAGSSRSCSAVPLPGRSGLPRRHRARGQHNRESCRLSHINPHSCLFTGTSRLTWQVTGGTGQFAGATGSFTGTVSGRALLARNAHGSCSTAQLPLHEVDKFAESGTLSF